ncbi:MAG: phage shock protein PspC (stress-responsive transcriptional regulator) [Pseudohongiellaceae bacterium]
MSNRKPRKRTLTLDKEHKKFLGVCAGVAEYLEVEPWTVRLVFLVSILFGGWFLIPIYFIAWFCLDDKPGEGLSTLAESHPMKHFRTVDYKKQLYRNTEDGKFLGICAGVADYLEVNVFAVRLVFLVLLILTSAIPLVVYFAAYFILDQKPLTRMRGRRSDSRRRSESRHAKTNRHADFVDDTASKMHQDAPEQEGENTDEDGEQLARPFTARTYSKRREFKYCARKFTTLQERLAKMEAYVTSNQFRLHREFKNI